MDERLKNVCKNYDIIVKCEFLDDDYFSQKLVSYYKQVVATVSLDDEGALKRLSKFDYVMKKYIEDYNFSKKLQNSIDVSTVVSSSFDYYDQVIEYVMSFSDTYDECKDEIVINTKWI
jgi:hypothetical protein